MVELLTTVLSIVAVGAGALNLSLGAFNRKPSNLSLAAVALVEIGLIVQLVASVIVLFSGQTSKGNIFEFFGYLLVALLVPAGAAFWALVERTRQSTLILGLAPLVIWVMLYRMTVIWFGQ
jgi:hypothetical protein